MLEGRITLDSRKPGVQFLIFALITAALVFAFFAVRWQLGDMLAEFTPPTDPNVSNIANLSETLAPRDPRAKWLAATASTNIFSPEAIDASVQLFADTVRLSPSDFRWWIEYGRSLESAGRFGEAEAALEQAVRIAPNYSHPHWQLGNFYLRQGRQAEAFRELTLATKSNSTYRNQVFALVWDYFGRDTNLVEKVAADEPAARADLAAFFVFRSKPAEGLQIWNSLSDETKTEYTGMAKTMAEVSSEIGAFREAVEFSRQAGVDPEAKAETITDPGFESPLRRADDTFFGWKIDRSDNRVDITLDGTVRHSGTTSLRMIFRNYTSQRLYSLWQNVAISPSTRYTLSFWIRTENLRSGGPPVFEVVAAPNSKVLAVSRSFPLGTNDWQQISVDFTAPDDGSGISVRTSRGYCGETCPIVGTVWLDDFELTKL